jgi:UDP-N-acetylglucosamine--N-acetylmuramyl-(pentapeptide) pyrophosphoryl-undecaprenol N-acetylglucosamine transferase
MILSTTVNLVIAGGGENDLLLPALAVADEFRRLVPNARVVFAGGGSTAEYRCLSDSGYEYRAFGLGGEAGWATGLIHRLVKLGAERQLLKQTRPAAVLCMGGPVGERMGRAAAGLDLPVIVFEPHFTVSPATRRLAPLADLVCLGFADTRGSFAANCPVRCTGIPVRRIETSRAAGAAGPDWQSAGQALKQLVILGDNNLSRPLNAVLPRALHRLDSRLPEWRVVHRTRSDEVRPVRRLYRRFGLDAVATAHIHKLPSLLSRADLVVAATSSADFADLAAAGAPTVLAVGNDGAATWHGGIARTLGQRGACVVVEDFETEQTWTRVLDPLLSNDDRRHRLASTMQHYFRADAAWHVASMVRDVITSARRSLSA